MRSIRNVVIYSLLLIGANAQSAPVEPIVLVEEAVDPDVDVTAQFEVNRELGRAWIEVDFMGWRNTEGPPPVKTERKKVEGLFYDPTTKRVLHRIGGNTVVCAEDVQSLWIKSLRPTGNCHIRVSTEERIADDGFETRKQRMVKVVFVSLPQKSNDLVSHAR